MATDLPWELREAIDRHARQIGPRELAQASEELSAQLRSPTRPTSPIVRSRSQVLAYAAYRVPATYAAAVAAFLAIREQRPAWQPRSMLDVGAGPGSAMWAATSVWPSLEALTALDAVPAMIAFGQELGRLAPHSAVHAARWVCAEVPAGLPQGPYDLIVLSYLLTELSPAATAQTVDLTWEATAGTLVLIMPGTPAGYAKIVNARTQLLQSGGHAVAPCPHDLPCPLEGADWCHFAVRLARSQVHKSAKHGVLGFEDEKFSYVTVSREPGDRAQARILRHPRSARATSRSNCMHVKD
jgi:ribosomal protein RSM22 (predicted rRNA methylase)